MIKKLLVLIFLGAALVSFMCFTALALIGGPDHPLSILQSWEDRGPTVSRDLPWSGGERFDIDYPAQITVTQGPQSRFTVTGPKSVVDALRLEGGSLITPHQDFFNFGRRPGRLKVEIVSPNTHEFHLSGAEKLKIVNFDQDSLILHCSGAADITAQGKAKRLEAHVSGAGNLDLEQLPVDDAKLSISGAADATLDPKVSADISISGAGHVKLKTRPTNLQTHISGFGSVDSPPDGRREVSADKNDHEQ